MHTCRYDAARPTLASCWPTWTASSSQSWMLITETVRAVADDHLEVAGVDAGAAVLQDEGDLGVRADLEHGVPVAAPVGGALHQHLHGLLDDGLGGHLDVQRLLGVLRRDGRGAVAGHQRGAAGGLAGGQRADQDLVATADLVGHRAVVGRDVVQRATQPLERREAPDLLAAGGQLVVVEVERRDGVQVAGDGAGDGRLHGAGDGGCLGNGHYFAFYVRGCRAGPAVSRPRPPSAAR